MSCLVIRGLSSFLKELRPLPASAFKWVNLRRSCAIAWSTSSSAGTTCRSNTSGLM
eukprot:CAMPEP_0118939180 /NCGR_PEP_ID=MMETSP1169-20130426/28200_1 /TAXON_ID=36882 /ORGANISM="Pyramimonas obovata, Strain CCMP722" /LENGTH=55 /DNA_ID=CAMNT_0006883381 /DNA_START=544 /DNA_END=711 /DNA_ORIENTATION=-